MMDYLPEHEQLARELEHEFAKTGNMLFKDAAVKIRTLHQVAMHEMQERNALSENTATISPTGEQLYIMGTGRFKNGSFPWAMASESAKNAWITAASDLLLRPDTILSRFSKNNPA